MVDTGPLVVVDVGVRGGPHPRWWRFGSEVLIVGVDADENECQRLSSLGSPVPVKYLPYALGAKAGDARTLYVTRQPGCSSLLEPDAKFLVEFPMAPMFDVVKKIPVSLTTLEAVLHRENIVPHVLKADTQGTELEIIIGAGAALDSVFLIEVEVEFNPVYKNQPLFADVDGYLRQQGFGLLGLRRDYWRRTEKAPSAAGGTLIHGDALFYRRDIPPSAKPLFAKALSAYNQQDFVHALGYSEYLNTRKPTWLVRFIGGMLSRAESHRRLRQRLDTLRPATAVDWHDADYF